MLTNEVEAGRESISCAWCSGSIPIDKDRVKLDPCGHVLCTFCALKSHAERGCKCQKCPLASCRKPTTKNKYIFAGDGSTKALNTEVNDGILKDDAPMQWLIKHYGDKIRESDQHQGVVLSCSKVDLNSAGKLRSRTVTSTIMLRRYKVKSKEVYEAIDHMKALVEVGDFFAYLHHPIVCASNTLEKNLPVLSPSCKSFGRFKVTNVCKAYRSQK